MDLRLPTDRTVRAGGGAQVCAGVARHRGEHTVLAARMDEFVHGAFIPSAPSYRKAHGLTFDRRRR
jgi:hypothetical protein